MNVGLEIQSSLSHFIEFFKLKIPTSELEEFEKKESKRKSLNRVNPDCILLIANFLNVFDQLALISTCNEFYKHLGTVRLRVVDWYYPMNVMPKDPLYQWKQLCVDWIVNIREANDIVDNDFEEIVEIEKSIKFYKEELSEISKIPQYVTSSHIINIVGVVGFQFDQNEQACNVCVNLEYIYKCQLITETKKWNDRWMTVCAETVHIYNLVCWMISDTGLLMDIPLRDNDLIYGTYLTDIWDEEEYY
jgi:hypothetical protein